MSTPKLAGSRLIRWKLTEPVRLYVYTLMICASLAALVAAALNSDPLTALSFIGPVVILFAASAVLGVEGARAATWPVRGVINEARKLARIGDVERATGL